MDSLTDAQIEQLATDGYVFLGGLFPNQHAEALNARLEELWEEERDNAGVESGLAEYHGRRLANLANKGDVFRPLITHPLILSAVETVLGSDYVLILLNARDVTPHTDTLQKLHCDTNDSGVPGEIGFYACTAAWLLDDFTSENGATRFVPRTHLSNKVPKHVMEDRSIHHPDEIAFQGKRGDVVVFNGHGWHGGGPNRTDAHRWGIFAFYHRTDVPRRENQRLLFSPDVAVKMNDLERKLLQVDD